MGRSGIDVDVIAGADEAAEIAELAAAAGLRQVWVSAPESRSGEPESADAALGRACSAAGSLLAVPILVPPASLSGAFARALAIAESGARIVRVCPAGHGYPLLDWVLSPIPELCDRHRMTLLLDFDGAAVPWDDVVRFARAFPGLPMVLLGIDAAGDYAVGAALDHTLNLLVATPGDRSPDLCSRFGSRRFVWSARDRRPAPRPMAVESAVLEGNALSLVRGSYAGDHL